MTQYRGHHSEERETCTEARRRMDITKGLAHVRFKKLNVSSSLGRVIGTGTVMSVSGRGGLIGPHSTHMVRRTYPLCLYVLSASRFFFTFTISVPVHQCILSNGHRSEAIVSVPVHQCILSNDARSEAIVCVPVHQCILSNGARNEGIVCGCWEASSTHVHT